LVPGNEEQQSGDIKAEAILAGEEIEEFPVEQALSGHTLSSAVIPGFGKYLLMGNCPGYAGDRDCQDEKPVDRLRGIHGSCTAISLPHEGFSEQ